MAGGRIGHRGLMAVYYYLAVGTASQVEAEAVTAHFAGAVLVLGSGLMVPCAARSERDWEGAWWSLIRPYGASINAVDWAGQPEPHLATDQDRREIGTQLIELLRGAPAFRYAWYGAEALDLFFDVDSTYNVVRRDPRCIQAGWAGLVIELAIWERIDRSPAYTPFGPGHVWCPFPPD